MTSRTSTAVAVAVAALAVACGGGGEAPAAGDPDPSVIVLARDDGWRDGLMQDVGHRYLVIEVASEPEAARQAWDDNVPEGLPDASGPPDEPGIYAPFDGIDLGSRAIVVVSSGTSSSCPAWPADLRVNGDNVEVDLATDVDADAACTDDLVPYRVVLAVERDRLPPSDALPLEDLDVPSENLTAVDGVMTVYPAN